MIVGVVWVVVLACVAPYNNLVVGNSFLIGGTIPVAVVLSVLVTIVLSRLLRLRLRETELVTILIVVLAGCAAISIGFVQYLVGFLAGLPDAAATSPSVAALLERVGLPPWAFPVDVADLALSEQFDAVRMVLTRVPEGESYPYAAWVLPLLSWGVFGFLLFTAIAMLAVIVRKQWVENERLPFPIATVLLSLVQQTPAEGTAKPLLASRALWIAAGTVIAIRSWNVWALYQPSVPAIPMAFDLTAIFANPPLQYAQNMFYMSGVYFAVIGVTFFLQTRIAFSIWFFYVLTQIASMVAGTVGGQITPDMQQDQTFGAFIAYSLVLIWIGRGHWWRVLKQMVAKRGADDEEVLYLSYRTACWLLLASVTGLVIWLTLAGAGFGTSLYIVCFVLVIAMMVARVAAETGLYYVQFPITSTRPIEALMPLLGSEPVSHRSFFWTRTMGALFAHDTREAASTYFTHGLKIKDEANPPSRNDSGWIVVFVMILAACVGMLASFASHLYFDFRHAATLADPPVAPVNDYAVNHVTRELVLSPTQSYSERHAVDGLQSPSFLIGAAATAACGVGRMAFAWFPLHPLGILLAYTFPISRMWFSIFVGWLLKAVVLRWGGAGLVRTLTPAFIGLVVGECVASGLWLVVSIVAASLGLPFSRVYFTP